MPRTTLGIQPAFAVGRGYLDVQPKASIAGNGNTVWTVPGGEVWRLATLFCFYTADANAANRVPALALRDADANTIAFVALGAAITANNTSNVTWAPGLNQVTANPAGVTTAGWPDIFVPPGWVFRLAAIAGLAGDTITQIKGAFWRYSIGADGYPIGADFGAVPPEFAELYD